MCTNTTCSCVNTTNTATKSWYWNCSCTYKSVTYKNLNLTSTSCTKNGTSYNCCPDNKLLNISDNNNGGMQMCSNTTCSSCVNTTSSDKKSWYWNCTCTYKNTTYKYLNLTTTSCSKNGTTYSCCVDNKVLGIDNQGG